MQTDSDKFRAAVIKQVEIERIVKNIIYNPILLVYYIVFGKEAVKLTKKHKGATLLQEVTILQQKWYSRGLSLLLMDAIKDALNVPYDMALTEAWLDERYWRKDSANTPSINHWVHNGDLTVQNDINVSGHIGINKPAIPSVAIDVKVVNARGYRIEADLPVRAIINGYVTGDAVVRWTIQCGGTMGWGDGTATPDVVLYRSAAHWLHLDDNFEADLEIRTNTNFNVGGVPGINQVMAIPDTGGFTHNLTFVGGILTAYSKV